LACACARQRKSRGCVQRSLRLQLPPVLLQDRSTLSPQLHEVWHVLQPGRTCRTCWNKIADAVAAAPPTSLIRAARTSCHMLLQRGMSCDRASCAAAALHGSRRRVKRTHATAHLHFRSQCRCGQGSAQFRCRCVPRGPSPGADVAAVSKSRCRCGSGDGPTHHGAFALPACVEAEQPIGFQHTRALRQAH
jgi:hypothetical protein